MQRQLIATLTDNFKVWGRINTLMEDKVGADAKLGHSYWMVYRGELSRIKSDIDMSTIRMIWTQEVLPQLIDNIVTANQQDLVDADSSIRDDFGQNLNDMLNYLDFEI